MRNVVKLIVLHVLILLIALQRSEAKVAPICGDHEDVAPPKDFEEKPHCWTLSAAPLEGTCDCGIAYVADTFGRCTSCSDGFKRNDKNECVHCPNRNERWCSKKKKCICIQNFHRNDTKSCVPCDEFEESNGYSKCKCAHGYTRRHEDDSVEGSCVLAPNSHGTKRIILAIVSISFLGSTIGYAIKKHGSRFIPCMKK